MTELLTAAQMRALEEAAIASGEVTGLELMERAGRGVVKAVFEEWPELAAAPHRTVVLCGPGNNGGDGFVVARLLKEWGWEVEVFLYGNAEKLPSDGRVNYDRWLALGHVTPLVDEAFGGFLDDHPDVEIYFDALFGTGLKRPLSGFDRVMMELNGVQAFPERKVVCVDVPSGLCADSGRYLGFAHDNNPFDWAIMGNLTVTFHTGKVGHYLASGATACGSLRCVDIGIEGSPRPRVGEKPPPMGAVGGCPAVPGEVVSPIEEPLVEVARKAFDGNKFSNGHALFLTGGSGKTGAARLAARGALRIGAGLVTLGVPGAAQLEVAGQVTSIMLKRAGTEEEVVSVLEDARINAVCLGPGLGLGRARGLVEAVLGGAHLRPIVLDADALSAFEGDEEALFMMLHEACVLTPHGGEFARLFPDIAERLNEAPTKGPAYSKLDAARDAAKRAGCVVLFKGPDTVIAAPDGRCSINSAQYERAAPWLATAGSGDVLAGFITGLLARGFAPMQAAETAAWLHVECARAFGPGLIAEDLPEVLPQVLRNLNV